MLSYSKWRIIKGHVNGIESHVTGICSITRDSISRVTKTVCSRKYPKAYIGLLSVHTVSHLEGMNRSQVEKREHNTSGIEQRILGASDLIDRCCTVQDCTTYQYDLDEYRSSGRQPTIWLCTCRIRNIARRILDRPRSIIIIFIIFEYTFR